jgi:hypothetical protein
MKVTSLSWLAFKPVMAPELAGSKLTGVETCTIALHPALDRERFAAQS